MKKLSKAEAETYASKLNGNQLLDISRKVVNMVGVENTIKIDGWTDLDVDSELVESSNRQNNAVDEYEQNGFTVQHRRGGKVAMKSRYGKNIYLRTNLEFIKHKIDNIDLYLNVKEGNLTAVDGDRYNHTGRRDNQLTKAFNKYLVNNLVQDYPEVCI